jgi:hypothetical protein
LQAETEMENRSLFSWSANDKWQLMIAVAENVPAYGYYYSELSYCLFAELFTTCTTVNYGALQMIKL